MLGLGLVFLIFFVSCGACDMLLHILHIDDYYYYRYYLMAREINSGTHRFASEHTEIYHSKFHFHRYILSIFDKLMSKLNLTKFNHDHLLSSSDRYRHEYRTQAFSAVHATSFEFIKKLHIARLPFLLFCRYHMRSHYTCSYLLNIKRVGTYTRIWRIVCIVYSIILSIWYHQQIIAIFLWCGLTFTLQKKNYMKK